MRRGNWRSPTVAEGYVAETNTGNMTIAAMLELLPPPTRVDVDAPQAKKRCDSPISDDDNESRYSRHSKKSRLSDENGCHYHFHVTGNGNSFVISAPVPIASSPIPFVAPSRDLTIDADSDAYEFHASQAQPLGLLTDSQIQEE